jgi:hypothetical protein
MEQRVLSFRERFSQTRPTKTAVFWSWLAIAVMTMIVGFTWGGWVTGGTARQMAVASGEDAVINRLTPMCILRVKADPKQAEKLKELKEISAWQQGEFVKKQGWATMPGEQEPVEKVADACAKLIVAS